MTNYKSSINKSIALFALVAVMYSCNQGPTLQKYYVDHELQPGFTSVDIPTSFLNLEDTDLTKDQLEAYESVEKLNMLAFVVNDDNKEEFTEELEKVKTILDDPKYEELMRGGNAAEGKFIIKILGEEDEIDEVILFGAANEKGFAVIRILGDDMNPEKIMSLTKVLENADFDDSQLNQITNIFK